MKNALIPRLIAFVACIFITTNTFADIQLPSIISDGMVLQQKSNVTLWGWAAPYEQVTVAGSWGGHSVSVKADRTGSWKVMLPIPAADGKQYTLKFKGHNTVELKNVLIGEVWLASGQSNMEFTMAKGPSTYENGVNDFENEVAKINNPKIRMYTVKHTVSDTLINNTQGDWQEANPQNARLFSALAYYFARTVFEQTGFPVGIISSTWGGTPAESWTRKDILQNDADLKVIMDHYEKKVTDYPQDIENYKVALAKWKADTAAANQRHATLPKAPVKPTGADDPHNPYKLYNGMIAPIVPYTIKGVIWYQGESNATRAYQYRKLFPAMIKSWRDDHHNNDLPFYFVQISPHRTANGEIREAQLITYRSLPHTGMVVTTDNGDSINIHPRNKELVGKRLALWPLSHEYGQRTLQYSGPLYKSMKVEGNQIRISFDEVGDGLVAKDGDLNEFAIAGDDQVFHVAQAKIDGNTVLVSSALVAKPVAVRFGWHAVPKPNLYNKAGLPASPFRTDSWKEITEGKD